MTTPEPTIAGQYKDDDLVYVDPDSKSVVGKVEFTKTDKPISKAYVSLKKIEPVVPVPAPVAGAPAAAVKPKARGKDKDEKRSFWRKYYPFGTYRSMKRIYKIEGKIKDPEPNKTLEEVLPKALSEAFWKWDEKKIDGPTPAAE